MSEPVTKQRSTVDLDAFEREMRDPSHYHNDDPLAELARLVGEEHDPYGDVFAREAHVPAHEPYGDGRHEPEFDREGPMSPRLSGDFAAIEAGLRGTVPPQPAYDAHAHAFEPAFDQGAHPTAATWSEPARARSRRPMYVVAATIAVGVIGVGTAFALKGHVSTSPREVKTILADETPTKVQPPAEAADREADAAAASGKTQAAPTAVATREEQPVDLLQAARENAAAQARMEAGRGHTDASSVPVPPSPGQVGAAATGTAAPAADAFAPSDMPAPKRVKVVSVRPDGTILPDDTPPPAAAPRAAPGKTSDRSGPVAKPSTPKTVAKTVSAKSTSRVAAPASIDQLAAAAPEDAAPAPKKPKLARVASADAGDQQPAPEPEATGTGGFAVQLAAPGSEADARATSSRLAKKFAGPLGAYHLAFHKAESNGKSVYRVRVSSLTRNDAVSLCEKLKADGGSCFVAKN